MPIQPDLQSGYVFPIITNGKTLYLSLIYYVAYRTLFWGGLILFLCAVIIDFYKDLFNRLKGP